MTHLWTPVGLLLLLITTLDVSQTVFIPRRKAGLLTRILYRMLWWTFRSPFTSPYFGSVLVLATLLCWSALLWLGFTCLFLPWTSRLMMPPGEGPLSNWWKAFYVSGYSITTLGVGDVHPTGGPLRILTVLAAASGFLLISSSVTYLLAVYAALAQMSALAVEISEMIGTPEGYTAVDVLQVTLSNGAQGELNSWLSQVANKTSWALQAEGQYPVLNYFHLPADQGLRWLNCQQVSCGPILLSGIESVTTLLRSPPDHCPAEQDFKGI